MKFYYLVIFVVRKGLRRYNPDVWKHSFPHASIVPASGAASDEFSSNPVDGLCGAGASIHRHQTEQFTEVRNQEAAPINARGPSGLDDCVGPLSFNQQRIDLRAQKLLPASLLGHTHLYGQIQKIPPQQVD